MTAVIVNLFALIAVVFSLKYSKEKTKMALKKGIEKGLGLLPIMLVIIFLIGLFFIFIPPDLIKNYLGDDLNIYQIVISALLGSITMIPSLIALPLAGSLVDSGASYTPVAAFITTLTMVGFVTIPIELKELGKKITIWRNVLAFIFSILIAFFMGVIM